MSGLTQSLPVQLEDTWAGLAQNAGLLRLEGDALVLEFETKAVELMHLGATQHRLPLAEVEACHWKPGWWGGKLEISVRRLAVLSGIPGAAQGRVTLKVSRKHRADALGLVASVELVLAHRALSAAETAARSSLNQS